MIKKVYRDKGGNVINIGEWDYMITYDEDDQEVVNNPLPDGATFADEQIVILDDGGLGAAY